LIKAYNGHIFDARYLLGGLKNMKIIVLILFFVFLSCSRVIHGSDNRLNSLTKWDEELFEKAWSDRFFVTHKTLRKIFDKGANPNKQEVFKQRTAFHYLLMKSDPGIKKVELFLQKGADAHIFDVYHRTPFHYALDYVEKNRSKIFDLIVKYEKNINKVVGFYESTMLHTIMSSSSYRTVEIVDQILKNGGDPNAQDSSGHTPLHRLFGLFCLDGKDEGILKLFLEKKADPNIYCAHGDTSFSSAVKGVHNECGMPYIEIFLKHGVSCNNHGPNKESILHYVDMSALDSLKLMKLFVDYKADPCHKNREGQYPYEMASRPFVRNRLIYLMLETVKEEFYKNQLPKIKTFLLCLKVFNKNLSFKIPRIVVNNIILHEYILCMQLVKQTEEKIQNIIKRDLFKEEDALLLKEILDALCNASIQLKVQSAHNERIL
jgi:ankyrin repeat protein